MQRVEQRIPCGTALEEQQHTQPPPSRNNLSTDGSANQNQLPPSNSIAKKKHSQNALTITQWGNHCPVDDHAS